MSGRNLFLALLLALGVAGLGWLLADDPIAPARPASDAPSSGAAAREPGGAAVLPLPPVVEMDSAPALDGRSTALDPGAEVEAAEQALSSPTCAASGRVVDEDGAPIRSASVAGPQGRRTETDAEGRWRLDDLSAGGARVAFLVEAPGFVPDARFVLLRGPEDVAVPDFVLGRPRPIEGRVVDATRRPVAHAHVEMHRDGRTLSMEGYETGDDGRFRFPLATAGVWMLSASSTKEYGCWDPMGEVPVRAGARDVEVVLQPSEPGQVLVHAEIVDAESGQPLLPLQAQLHRGPAAEPAQCAVYEAIACDLGHVAVEGCHAGNWRLWVRVDKRSVAFADFDVFPGTTEANLRIEIGRPGSIVGRVIPQHGLELRGLQARVHPRGADLYDTLPRWPGEGALQGLTPVQADGSFRFSKLAPGHMLVSVEGSGVVGSAEVDVLSGGESLVEVRAVRGARLVFREAEPLPAGTMVFPTSSEGDVGWKTWPVIPGSRGGPLWELTAQPGRVQWYIRFLCLDEEAKKFVECLEAQHGGLEVQAGETIHIPLPVVRKP